MRGLTSAAAEIRHQLLYVVCGGVATGIADACGYSDTEYTSCVSRTRRTCCACAFVCADVAASSAAS